MEESVNELDAVFKKERGSDLTDEVATLDDRRDKAYLCLSMMTKAYGYHFDEAKLAATNSRIRYSFVNSWLSYSPLCTCPV
ncbi:MAG: hypothetical protein KGY69_16290 [Bacteroidales bacterium]|nr:hypothetical protein [Bacteroidales bacterium]